MANARKMIKRIIRYHREWLGTHGSDVFEQSLESLGEKLQDASPHVLQAASVPLHGLATYFGIRGIVEVVDGNNEGWKSISTSIDFHAWDLKVSAEWFFRQPRLAVGGWPLNLTNYTSIAACLTCASEKWGPMAEAILGRIDNDADSVDQRYWETRRFEPFVIACCELREGELAEDRIARIREPYQSVLLAWNDESQLQGALEAVCDYHCQNMDDTGGDWDPEFDHPPFDLLPCEAMLVRGIREQLGLPVPPLEHPLLMALNLDSSASPSYPEHDLVQAVALAFSRCFGEGFIG